MTRSGPHPAPNLDPALSRWLDGQSSPEEAKEVEARLESDPRLAAQVARLREAMATLKADAARAPHPDLAVRVLASVARGDPAAVEVARFDRAARRWAIAAALLIAVGGGGTAALRADRDGTGTPSLESGDGATHDLLAHVESSRAETERALDLSPASPDALHLSPR